MTGRLIDNNPRYKRLARARAAAAPKRPVKFRRRADMGDDNLLWLWLQPVVLSDGKRVTSPVDHNVRLHLGDDALAPFIAEVRDCAKRSEFGGRLIGVTAADAHRLAARYPFVAA